MQTRSHQSQSRWQRQRAERRRRRRAIAAAVAGALVVGAGAWFVLGRDDGPATLRREGSDEVDGGDDAALVIGDEPEGYRILYRMREAASEPRSEVVTVRRPFESRTESYDDPDGEGKLVSLNESAFGRIGVGAGSNRQILALGPVTAGADLRLAPVLDDALEHGLLERREQREVAGRRCQVYRAASSVLGGELDEVDDEAEEYADACFDEAGLLLEEWWIVDGKPIRQRVAVEVDEEVTSDVTGELATEATTVPIDMGGGSIQRMRPDSAPPGAFFALEEVPPGFEAEGRYTVIPTQSAAFSDPTRRGDIVASTADMWRRGIDILVVDQGGTLEQRQVFNPDPDNEVVDLPLGEGELILGLGGNEVRILRSNGRFIRVYGTLPIDELVEVARALVETEGTEIVLEE